MDSLLNVGVLFCLGFIGWQLFRVLHLPVAPLLGSVLFIGALRAGGIEIPPAPGLLSLLVPTMLGYSVGARVNGETVKQLGAMVRPAGVVVLWTLAIAFILGTLLSRFTALDFHTAILSSSMGGLAEMTVIALETEAEVSIVIIMHTFRLFITTMMFPFVMKHWASNVGEYEVVAEGEVVAGNCGTGLHADPPKLMPSPQRVLRKWVQGPDREGQSWGKIVGTPLRCCGVAVAGAILFSRLGVPAGAMVGSMLFVAAASLWGMSVPTPSAGFYNLMLLGLGITVSSNIDSSTSALLTGRLVLPILLSTVVVLVTSWLVANIIYRIVDWDFPTCFLAAAPAGITAMTTLAIAFDKDPFPVSTLHLCRLLTLKTVIPLFFWLVVRG